MLLLIRRQQEEHHLHFISPRKLSIKKKSLGLQTSAGLSAIKENGGNVYEKTNQCMYVSNNDERD